MCVADYWVADADGRGTSSWFVWHDKPSAVSLALKDACESGHGRWIGPPDDQEPEHLCWLPEGHSLPHSNGERHWVDEGDRSVALTP